MPNKKRKELHKAYIAKTKLASRLIKILIICSLLSVVVWSLYSFISGRGTKFFLSLIASNLLNMDVKPAVLTGITTKGLKYNITSEAVDNYIANFFYNENIDFKKPKVKLQINNGVVIDLVAKTGKYDESKSAFFLNSKVDILSSDGAFLETENAVLDLKNFDIYSNYQTRAQDQGHNLYSKGFRVFNNFNNLLIKGPVVISDMTLKRDKYDRASFFKENYFKAEDEVLINNSGKEIISKKPFFAFRRKIKISGNSFNAKYLSLGGFKNSRDAISNFSRIEVLGEVEIINLDTRGVARGEKYIYDVIKDIMILSSSSSLTTYSDDKYHISVKDRFEFNRKEGLVVARGKPQLLAQDEQGNTKYDIVADLAYAKLKPSTYDIEYAEIFDNITIKSSDGSLILADYGYLDYPKNILFLEDNIKIINEGATSIEACEVFLDIASGKTEIIKCKDQDAFSTTVKRGSLRNEKYK